MQVEAIEPLALGDSDIAAWHALQASDRTLASPYLTPDWARLVNRYRPDARVVVFRENGNPVGFLPVQLSASSIALPLGGPLCDYQAIISEPGSVFDGQKAIEALGVRRIDFTCALADHSATKDHVFIEDHGHIVRFEDGWSAYETERREAGSQVLKRTRKKMNKFRRECGNISFHPFVRDDKAFETLLGWKRTQHRQTGSTDILSRAWIRYVVDAVYQEQSEEFGGELFLLRSNDELVAGLFCIRAGKTLHAWYVGHNHDFDTHSPGLILFTEAIRAAADAGFTEMDLGAGDYRFKQSLANHSRACGPGYIGAGGLSSAWRGMQFGVRQQLESRKMGRLSLLPGKAMRRLDVWRCMAKSRP
tara:strand:- start:3426 stop:4511 length:1086 start_codon:yes stop_codon:yes gene_type:complete